MPGKPPAPQYVDLERRIPYYVMTLRGEGYYVLYANSGNIDGGDMNGCSPAMDYLDMTLLDGGAL